MYLVYNIKLTLPIWLTNKLIMVPVVMEGYMLYKLPSIFVFCVEKCKVCISMNDAWKWAIIQHKIIFNL